ncbi:MAG: serine/threonine protein kinase [Sandaracinus sp.]|nr:serine/threonine protein kinase [Sandaracinus sp.]MCB9630556.1 serine/threonine protein kinase [Sandaracinus sp.]
MGPEGEPEAEDATVVARPRRSSETDASGERERFTGAHARSVTLDLSESGADSHSGPWSTPSLVMRSTTSAPLATASEFLRADEINRIRTMSIGLLVACGAGAGMLALLPGDPIATRWAMLGLGLLVLAFGGLVWVARDVRTFNPNAVGMLSLVNAVASAMMAFYFGVFSPFPSLVALVLFTYSLGAPLRWASVVWGLAAGAQLTLGLLVSFEVVPDRGLVRPENLDLTTKLVAQAAIQLVYGVSFVVGHAIGRRTRVAADALESAVRQVAARDALLREARAELERAAGLGGSGRFTGQRLGSFELGVIIGRGGMGEIYGAVHVESGEEAAVKLLQRGAASIDSDPIARFEREARIVAALDSPHVVRVLEIGGAEAPLPYLAMELLRGRDLAWHLRERRKLTPKQVAELVRHAASGLEKAWERRIVHRDLKPQNLFLSEGPGGAVWKVLDFGISKLAGESGTLSAGHLVGTPAYMAPEQVRGTELDHRTDVHALAAIAYRALTGRPAFAAKEIPQLVSAVADSLPPRPGELVSVPGPVDDVLRIGLAKSPEDRFATAVELARAFDAALRGERDPKVASRARTLEAELAWGGWMR